MINVESSKLGQLAIHRVGNKHNEENTFTSQALTPVNDDIKDLLMDFFLNPFVKITEKYKFVDEVDVEYNTLNGIAEKCFDDKSNFYEYSTQILRHLYNQSNHPHIKSGDLFCAYFDEMFISGEPTQAIGIFKSERKDSFFKVEEKSKKLTLNTEKGISVKKLDKGALILNTEEGIVVLTVDNNSYDAEYWKKAFLSVDYVKDSNFETNNFLELCKSFARDVVGEETKKDEIDFVNHSVDYVGKSEKVDVEEFSDVMFSDEEIKGDFREYKTAYEEEYQVEIAENFDVSEVVLETQKRKVQNTIKLDTHIQLKLDFNDIDSMNHFVERGFDEEKQMMYYKVFFNEEVK